MLVAGTVIPVGAALKAGQPVFRAVIGGVGRTSVTTAAGVGTNFVVAPIAASLAKSAGIDPIWANDIGIGTGFATSIFTGREAYKGSGNGAEVEEVSEGVDGDSDISTYKSLLGEMSKEDAIRYDGYWKYQEAIKNGQFLNGSIYDGWYKIDGSMNYPDYGGAIPGTQQNVTLGENGIVQVGRYGQPTSTSAYVTETGVSADRLALPPTTDPSTYIEYKIVKPIENTERAVVAPWVGDKGLGIQYKLPKPIQWYIDNGYLIEK